MTTASASRVSGRRGSVARPAAVSLSTLGPPGVLSFFDPAAGATILIVETVAFLVVLGTALFGSETISERGFRILRWITNRAEPPSPRPRPAATRGSPSERSAR